MWSLCSQSLVNLLHIRELCHMTVGQQEEYANLTQLNVIQKVSCCIKKSHVLARPPLVNCYHVVILLQQLSNYVSKCSALEVQWPRNIPSCSIIDFL